MDIRDIARLSGYSVGTVSRVLNDNPGVSDRARERVLSVVREVGYEPNTNARHLKTRSRASFAIMVKGMQNLLFNDIIEKAEGLFAEADEEVRVHFVDEDADEVARAAHLDRIRHPKGFLFLGGDPNNFKESFAQIEAPCVLLTNTAEDWGLKGLSSFSTERLLERADDLTAVFAFGDVIALGALRAISDRGFRVPADISVVGFDGVDVSQYSVPRLTTVRQDAGLLARKGVEALIAAARGDERPARHESVPFRLLRRESVLSLRVDDSAGGLSAGRVG